MALVFFFQAEDGIRDWSVTGVQTCALPICDRDELRRALAVRDQRPREPLHQRLEAGGKLREPPAPLEGSVLGEPVGERSEERRVGKACRSRWPSYESTKKR